MGLADRIGAALLHPGDALAAADGERGRAGADAFVLLGLKVLCLGLPGLVAAVWSVLVIGPGAGLGQLLGTLDDAWRIDVLLIFGATLVITVGAGRKRDWARDFDLAAAAWIPALVVEIAAAVTGLFAPFAWLRRAAAIGAVAVVAVFSLLAIRVARGRK